MSEATEPLVRLEPGASPAVSFWRSAIGKKALMAASGLVLFAWLLVHMLGNLQAFEGAEKLDAYGRLLRIEPALLWTVRVVLLVTAAVHAVAGIQLWIERRRTRPTGYREYRPVVSTTSSRTMIWSGFLVLGFVVYHLLDLTFGVANPDYRSGEVFHNLLASLGRAAASAFYVVAVAGLGVHLCHGLWSMTQSLGLSNRAYVPAVKRLALALGILLALGFAAVPLAVLLGVMGS